MVMKINAKFDRRELVHSSDLQWLDSPMAGVSRKPLDRVGDEVARATSIVRYEAGSHFSPHVHTGGEEFLVIDGVFQDEHGDYPAGFYIRNAPNSSHTPGSDQGCVIFVKLWQFDPQDRTSLKVDVNSLTPSSITLGVTSTNLFENQFEKVEIINMQAESTLTLNNNGGAELLMLDGEVIESDDVLRKGSWLRLPVNSDLKLATGRHGARFWIKRGHLAAVDSEVERVLSVAKRE